MECRVHSNTSSSCAIARRCCLAMAVSFCWTIRSRLIDSLSCTLILDCFYCGEHSLKESSFDGDDHTTIDDEGAMMRYCSTVYFTEWRGKCHSHPPAAGYLSPTSRRSICFYLLGTEVMVLVLKLSQFLERNMVLLGLDFLQEGKYLKS